MEEQKSPVTQAQLQTAYDERKARVFAKLLRSCDEAQLKTLDLSNIKMDEVFFSKLLAETIHANAYAYAAARQLIASNKAFDYDKFITDGVYFYCHGEHLDFVLENILPMTSRSPSTIWVLLNSAFTYCKADAARQLLQMGKLDINVKSTNGKSTFLLKLFGGINLDQVKLLVEACGAKFTQTDIDDYIKLGENTNDFCTHNNYKEIADYLTTKLQEMNKINRHKATMGAITVMGLLKRTPCPINPKPCKEISQLIGQMVKLKF